MSYRSLLGVLPLVAVAFAIGAVARPLERAEPKLAHMVFFTLKDHSKTSRDAFIASCNKYLSGHKGASYFSVGAIAEDVVEGPSVRDFDVALHVVFGAKSFRDEYLKNPRHDSFVAENKAFFDKVRVFDSYLASAPN